MPSNLEQIGALSRVWDQNSLQQIAGMWRDVVWEYKWCGDNVSIQEVDVVAFGVGRVVVER